MQYRRLNVQEHPVIESCMAVATYLHQTYLGQQITTVRRWINECSSQTLVLKAANRPLRPRILTAFRADNIVYFYMHVSRIDRTTRPKLTNTPSLFIYAKPKCLSNLTLPQLLAVTFKAAGKLGKGYRGNTKWRKITHSFHKQTFAFLECVWFILKHGC